MAGAWSGTVCVFNARRNKLESKLEGAASVRAVAYAPSQKQIAAAQIDGQVKLWSVETGRVVGSFGDQGILNALAFSEDGETLVSASDDAKVRVLSGRMGRELSSTRALEEGEGGVNAIAVSPNGESVAVGLQSGKVAIYHRVSGTREWLFEGHSGAVTTVTFESNLVVATGSLDSTIRMWSIRDGIEVVRFDEHRGAVNDLECKKV